MARGLAELIENADTPGARLHNARVTCRTTIRELEAGTGIPKSTIAAWERGTYHLRRELVSHQGHVKKLSAYLGISEDVIWVGTQPSNPLKDNRPILFIGHGGSIPCALKDYKGVVDRDSGTQTYSTHELFELDDALDPDSAVLLDVNSHYMSPRLAEADRLVADTKQREPRDGYLFVCVYSAKSFDDTRVAVWGLKQRGDDWVRIGMDRKELPLDLSPGRDMVLGQVVSIVTRFPDGGSMRESRPRGCPIELEARAR